MPRWARSQGKGLTDAAVVAERFAFLGRRRIASATVAVEEAPAGRLLTADFPLLSELVERAIDRLYRVENLEDRFAVCLFLLKDQTLGYRQKEVMADLLGVVKQMMRPDRHMDAEKILSRLTEFFRDRDNEFLLMRFQCYEAIGVAIGEAGNVSAADHVIQDIVYWRFQYPEIQGATDEWETVVNPYHLPKIRCWMHIIESNPALYERLAAALNVQLRLGGVYIADTDLFQRDVTRFLNADIRPIYFVAKQLLRTLPVYFNEVGAEGELRAVSTQIDEICGRRDTLMHFLRKQAHAESSNRMVPVLPRRARVLAHAGPVGSRAVHLGEHDGARARRARLGARPPRGPGRRCEPSSCRLRGRPLRSAAADGEAASAPEGEDLLDALLAMAPEALEEELGRLEATANGSAAPGDTDRRRVALLVRTYQLVALKYSLSAGDVGVVVESRPADPAAHAPALRARHGGVAAAPRARGARPPARRRADRARGAEGDRARAGPVGGDREHLPEAPHRRRHPLDLRQLQRAQVRRARGSRSASRPSSDGCSRTSSPRASSPTSRAPRCGAWPTPSCASSARSPSTASTRAPSRPTSRCSRRASASTTSPSTSTRTCSSSWSTA